MTRKPETMKVHEVHELLWTDPAAVLVCTCEGEEFLHNDLEGAISLSEFRRRKDSLPKDETIIFYGASSEDEAAAKRAQECSDDGFLNVMILEGGAEGWKNAGYGLVAANR